MRIAILLGGALAALALLAGCGGGGALTLGTVPNGGTQEVQGAAAQRVKVPLRPFNAAGVGGTAVLQTAQDEQKTRVDVSLGKAPGQEVTVSVDVGSCSDTVSLRHEFLLGTMTGEHASWRIPGRLASLQSAPSAVVLRGAETTSGGPVAACGEIPNG